MGAVQFKEPQFPSQNRTASVRILRYPCNAGYDVSMDFQPVNILMTHRELLTLS